MECPVAGTDYQFFNIYWMPGGYNQAAIVRSICERVEKLFELIYPFAVRAFKIAPLFTVCRAELTGF